MQYPKLEHLILMTLLPTSGFEGLTLSRAARVETRDQPRGAPRCIPASLRRGELPPLLSVVQTHGGVENNQVRSLCQHREGRAVNVVRCRRRHQAFQATFLRRKLRNGRHPPQLSTCPRPICPLLVLRARVFSSHFLRPAIPRRLSLLGAF